MALDKYIATSKWETAARMIKEGMDKKWGGSWHVCVGEGFGFSCHAPSEIDASYVLQQGRCRGVQMLISFQRRKFFGGG